MKTRRFTATVTARQNGGAFVAVPFDPDEVWSPKPRHHVNGTVNGVRIRGVIETSDGSRGFTLGPVWMRDCGGFAIGDEIVVEIAPEGPQRADLADDVAEALDANPQAAAFFDSLATFYRKAYLRWIDATKRRPDQRPLRIAEMITLLEAGVKERPKP